MSMEEPDEGSGTPARGVEDSSDAADGGVRLTPAAGETPVGAAAGEGVDVCGSDVADVAGVSCDVAVCVVVSCVYVLCIVSAAAAAAMVRCSDRSATSTNANGTRTRLRMCDPIARQR